MNQEIWKNIQGYEGYYEISNFGKIKSLPGKWKKFEKILTLIITGGYQRIKLYRNTDVQSFAVHRLVALHFIPNPDKLPEINHKNCIKIDNRVENLEWCTRQGNIDHAVENNLNPTGETHGRSKLNNIKILEIRKKYVPRTYSQRRLAKEYHIGRTAILNILQGKTWKHI